ncbi:Probable ubiquitin-conjugating enzyme E2 23 [Ancistrocladus abbreviatus]
METKQHGDVSNANEATRIVNESINTIEEGITVHRSSVDVDFSVNGNEVDISQCNVKRIYGQDVVKRNDGSIIGVVTEVAGDSDSESEITEDDEDDLFDDDDDDKEAEDGERDEEEGNNVENKRGDKVRNSDATESDDESRNADHNKGDPLCADQVRVLWMDDSETTHTFNDLTVVDRGFLHGDYVASDLDPTGQIGLVVDINVSVDLLAPDGSILKDVSSRDLKRVRDITVGDYVVFGSWLGRVDDALDNVTVLFPDGSICKVMQADPLQLRPILKNLLEDGHCPYHPGQRVRARSSSVFKNCQFLSGTWKAHWREGTLIKVTVGLVYVHWLASAGYGPESSTTPAEEQNPKNLKLLSCFTHASWQLRDWCLLPSSTASTFIPLDNGLSKLQLQGEPAIVHAECDSEDVMLEESNCSHEDMGSHEVRIPDGADRNAQNAAPKSSSFSISLSVSKESAHGGWPIHRKKLRKVVVRRDKKPQKKEKSYEKALLIVNTRTRVDVAWQDGTTEQGVNSTCLIPIQSPGHHDFVAEQYVVEKGADDTDNSSEIRRVGVVKSLNAKEKTACVRWLKPVARPEDPREFDKEELVSVYELEGHPHYDYCYGDVVVHLSSVSVPGETAHSGSVEEKRQLSGSGGVKRNVKECSSQCQADDASSEEASAEFSNLSWVGNITGLRNGDIEVTWADGMVSTVGPQAVYVVGRDDDDASIAAGSEMDDAASWETVEDDEMDSLEISGKELESPRCTNTNPDAGERIVDGENNPGRNGPLSIPLAAIGFVTRLATGIFSLGRKEVVGSEILGEEVHLQKEINTSNGRSSSSGSSSQDSTVIDCVSQETNDTNGQEMDDDESSKLLDSVEVLFNLRNAEPNGLLCGDEACSFKRFDTAKDPVDHFFLGANIPSNASRKWLKKVQQDWTILQNNLPDGICVRVYEDRMDLVRAVIVGAYGTPYLDGLFFFDFHLPPEYPDLPPSAHYHSGGWRINPNLYEEGKVCLSLLNTWTGRGNEIWDPKSSSILQVLVSLQGLVLNSKPYFNEAGYDKQIGTAEGEKNSLSYNENTFLLNCKTMMYLIRKPPKDFEDLVKDHFKQRGYYILKVCDAYMKGYLIGSLSKDASVTDNSEASATSVGFKLMLAKIVPKLFLAFSELGADCSEFKHLQQL